MSRARFVSGLLSAFLVALGLTGCGKSGPEILAVSGVVTLDGQPLDQARVVFVPAKGRPAVGLTDAKGAYQLQFTEDRWGATAGPHKVMITTERSQTGGEGAPLVPGRKELLPKRYHETTELQATVAPDKQTFDFALTSKSP